MRRMQRIFLSARRASSRTTETNTGVFRTVWRLMPQDWCMRHQRRMMKAVSARKGRKSLRVLRRKWPLQPTWRRRVTWEMTQSSVMVAFPRKSVSSKAWFRASFTWLTSLTQITLPSTRPRSAARRVVKRRAVVALRRKGPLPSAPPPVKKRLRTFQNRSRKFPRMFQKLCVSLSLSQWLKRSLLSWAMLKRRKLMTCQASLRLASKVMSQSLRS